VRENILTPAPELFQGDTSHVFHKCHQNAQQFSNKRQS